MIFQVKLEVMQDSLYIAFPVAVVNHYFAKDAEALALQEVKKRYPDNEVEVQDVSEVLNHPGQVFLMFDED
jgi:hypothetical protein